MSIGFMRTNDNITIIAGDRSQSFSKEDSDYEKYLQFIKQNDFESVEKLFNSDKKVIEDAGFETKDSVIYLNNRPVVPLLANRIKRLAEQKKDSTNLIKFWQRLLNNPSKWCLESLFNFLDKNNCPISEDGKFMAYKAVRNNFTDKYSGEVDNSPGKQVPPFLRNEVDDDRLKSCSFGYHVGSTNYVRTFGEMGDKFIEVLVDPADVISIPSDVNENKMRVCTYKVIREIKREELDYNKYEGDYDYEEDEDDF